MPKGIPGSKAPHRTVTRYVHHGCRCDECRCAATAYKRERQGEMPRDEWLALVQPPHGTDSRAKTCRCDPCRGAASEARKLRRLADANRFEKQNFYKREWRKRRREAETQRGT